MVVVRTNYATNLETPRAIGAKLDIVDLAFDDRWRLDVDARRGGRAARRDQADLGDVPAQPDRDDARPRRVACARRARRAVRVRCCSSTRRIATSRTAIAAADGRDALGPARSACRRCRRRTGCRACASAGRCAATATWPRPLLAAKEQMFICGATLDEAIAGRVLERTRADPHADPRRRARPARDRARLDGRPAHVRVDRARGRSGRARAVRARHVEVDTDRFYDVLLAELRHVRGARATGSRSTTATSAWVRMADRSRADGRARGADGRRPGNRTPRASEP